MEGTNLPALQWEGFKRLPDKGIMKYVEDTLEERFDVETKSLPEHWLAIGVMGTLDWVMICGWWVFRNTGFFETDEPHRFVFRFNGCELDPSTFTMFKEDAERNKFDYRFENPGIDGKERSEALQFLIHDVYESWARENQKDPEEYTPPDAFIEMVMYATFMWVLSPYGKDWIYMQDETLACVLQYGAAYVDHSLQGEARLLDPNLVEKIERPLHSCASCHQVLWCVKGIFFSIDDEGRWESYCNHCFVELWEQGVDVEARDNRIISPQCPHKKGSGGVAGTCSAHCPHSHEYLWGKAEEHGSERLNYYREYVNSMGGASPRQIAGQTVDEIIGYFKD